MFSASEQFGSGPSDDQGYDGDYGPPVESAYVAQDGPLYREEGHDFQPGTDSYDVNYASGTQDASHCRQQYQQSTVDQMSAGISEQPPCCPAPFSGEKPEEKKRRKNREAAARCQKRKKEHTEILRRDIKFLQHLVDQMKTTGRVPYLPPMAPMAFMATPQMSAMATPPMSAMAAPPMSSMTTPHMASMATPRMAPMAAPPVAPMSAPRMGPMAPPRTGPMASPRTGPMASPRIGPMASPCMGPMASPRMGPMAAPHMAPIAVQHMAPMAALHMAPMAARHMVPMAAQHMAPMPAPHVPPMQTSTHPSMSRLPACHHQFMSPPPIRAMLPPMQPRSVQLQANEMGAIQQNQDVSTFQMTNMG